jgi:gluconolactonase
MKTVLPFLFLALSMSSTIAAQQMKPASEQSNPKFSALEDQFVKESLALSPVNASQAGYHNHVDAKTGKTIMLDAQLDDVSPQAMATQAKFYRDWRKRFETETPAASLNSQDAADYRLIDDQISLNLLEFDTIQNYKHNPTVYVELLGNGLFLPLSQEYASKEVRVGDVISRISQIPRFLEQSKSDLVNADPIFISTAIDENDGNAGLVDSVANDAASNPNLKAQYEQAAPAAKKAIADFSDWLKNDLAKRPTNGRNWRLGSDWYALKFRNVMETAIEPAQLLADAEARLKEARAEMLQIALPLYKEMYPGQDDYSGLPAHDRENKIIPAVLDKISEEHPQRGQLIEAVKADLAGITQFIRDKQIVTLSSRDNLKVIPTPEFMRGIYSVAGFHAPPPLEPTAEAQYWVTPIDPKMPDAKAESKLREYNNYTLKWLTMHEALPGHYIQGEHADDVEPVTRRLVRNLFGNGSNVEGWAEYISDVMTDAGYLDNSPKFRLMRLKVSLRSMVNAILDIRLQTMNMTDEQALDLMMKDAFQTQAEADGKLVRAKLSSTQLPTYFVGTRQWWTLRKKYQAAKGDSFTLAEFHNRALDQGPLPLDYLEKVILPAQEIQRLDAAVDQLVPADAKLERVATGFEKWTEGPVWTRDGSLLFAVIPANSIVKWTPGKEASVFMKPSGYTGAAPYGGPEPGSNGMTLDADGRVAVAGHARRNVWRLESVDPAAQITVLADSYQGKKLNSPNDLVYKSDGSLYFTDPPYGLPTQQDSDPLKELQANGVYRVPNARRQKPGAQPDREKLQLIIKNLPRPNGIAFSPDEKTLYIADSGKKMWMRYPVKPDGTVGEGAVLLDASGEKDPGGPDGIRVDKKGNIYGAGPGGVWIISPAGKHLGTIRVPEVVSNVAWGDKDGKTLYITASTSLYRIKLAASGVRN